MRDIYLIDFENVASEGLVGITYLAPEDEVIIFYSNNSNRLSMKMHILIGKSVCKCDYYEVTVGGKNALDHQISTWLGYMIGTKAADRNYYIVSKDMGYKFVASFWTESPMHPNVRCIDNIRMASRLENRSAKTEPLPVMEEPESVAEPEIPVETPAPEPVLSEFRTAEPAAEAAVPTATEASEATLPAPESVPVIPAEPEPVKKPAAKRTLFGVVLPDWPEKTQEPQAPVTVQAPVSVQTPEPPAQESPAEEPAPEVSAEQEPEAEAEPVSKADRTGVWPPLEDKPDENDTSSRSRSRSRSRRSRGRGRSSQKETEEIAEAAPASKSEPEKKPEKKQEQKTDRKSSGKGKASTAKPEQDKKSDAKSKSEKKTDSKKPNISGLIAPYPGLQEQHLQQLIADNKKQILCNTLRKQLGQEKGLALYNEIKKLAWK